MAVYFYRIPSIFLFVALTLITILISIYALWIIRRVIPYKVREHDNPVIGSISSLIGIIYGVLVGLTALYLINNISYTSAAVVSEANAVANIYRDSQWFTEPTRSEFKKLTTAYLKNVIDHEWLLMKEGKKIGIEGNLLIEKMADYLKNYPTITNAELLIMHDMLLDVKTLYNARELRIHMSYTSLNPAIWLVILIGTILTIAITYLFNMNYYLHIVSVCAAALMASSMIYLLVTLDRPFQGEFNIPVDAFINILNLMNESSKSHHTTTISKTNQSGDS